MAAPEFRAHQIAVLTPLNSTGNANPRWQVTFEEITGPVITSSDISDAAGIGNPGVRPGDTVHVAFTPAGRIARIHPPRFAGGTCRQCGITETSTP